MAARQLQLAIGKPLDQSRADSVLLSAMLLNFLSFTGTASERAEESWVFSNKEDRLWWFALQLGLKPVINGTEPFHGQQSILHIMFSRAQSQPSLGFHCHSKSEPDIPEHWLALCDSDPWDDDETGIHRNSLLELAKLRNTEPRAEYFLIYMSWFGTLDKDFYHLLNQQDERALWVIGYWYGLLARYDVWWCSPKAFGDYNHILLWIKSRGVFEKNGLTAAIWEKLIRDLEDAMYWQPEEPGLDCINTARSSISPLISDFIIEP